jgi:hypothetical protein
MTIWVIVIHHTQIVIFKNLDHYDCPELNQQHQKNKHSNTSTADHPSNAQDPRVSYL